MDFAKNFKSLRSFKNGCARSSCEDALWSGSTCNDTSMKAFRLSDKLLYFWISGRPIAAKNIQIFILVSTIFYSVTYQSCREHELEPGLSKVVVRPTSQWSLFQGTKCLKRKICEDSGTAEFKDAYQFSCHKVSSRQPKIIQFYEGQPFFKLVITSGAIQY